MVCLPRSWRRRPRVSGNYAMGTEVSTRAYVDCAALARSIIDSMTAAECPSLCRTFRVSDSVNGFEASANLPRPSTRMMNRSPLLLSATLCSLKSGCASPDAVLTQGVAARQPCHHGTAHGRHGVCRFHSDSPKLREMETSLTAVGEPDTPRRSCAASPRM